MEACRALTFISLGSREEINQLISHGVIPKLVAILRSHNGLKSKKLIHQVVIILGNIAKHDALLRKEILKEKALVPLIALLMLPHISESLVQDLVVAMFNLCWNCGSLVDVEKTLLIPVLSNLMSYSHEAIQSKYLQQL